MLSPAQISAVSREAALRSRGGAFPPTPEPPASPATPPTKLARLTRPATSGVGRHPAERHPVTQGSSGRQTTPGTRGSTSLAVSPLSRTSANDVIIACRNICQQDPLVSGAGAASAASAGTGLTSAQRDAVLRRWAMYKLLASLPPEVLRHVSGLDDAQFTARSPEVIAKFLLAKGRNVTPNSIDKARRAFGKLHSFMLERDVPWENDIIGNMADIDLFSFLMQEEANSSASAAPASAMWTAYAGLTFWNTRLGFTLPLHNVRPALPSPRGAQRGRTAVVSGADPLPPELVQAVCDLIRQPTTPPALRAWGLALVITAFASLRQKNAQNIAFYGEIRVDDADFMVCHHADGKRHDGSPVVFLLPLQDFKGSREWFDSNVGLLWPDADFLWHQILGQSSSMEATILPAPLSEDKILQAMHQVIRKACNVPLEHAQRFCKHSARKMMLSLAASAGVPWDCQVELGHWSKALLDSSFVLPSETLRRKSCLSAMQMPKIYGQHGRLVRAARIARNQIVRGGEYLHRRAHVSGIDRLTPDWQLVPPYNPAVEGA